MCSLEWDNLPPEKISFLRAIEFERYQNTKTPTLHADSKLANRGVLYFVDNQRFISAATRSRPASASASLRCRPNGILRALAITSVARASQSWLRTDCANIRLRGELIMMLPE
jgi:hypothetical protein